MTSISQKATSSFQDSQKIQPSVVSHTCNARIWDIEEGGSEVGEHPQPVSSKPAWGTRDSLKRSKPKILTRYLTTSGL